MEVIKAIAVALLLLLLGDFVATFAYHVPEHVFGKFHSIVHHSPQRSFVRYAIRHQKPIALIEDGHNSGFREIGRFDKSKHKISFFSL